MTGVQTCALPIWTESETVILDKGGSELWMDGELVTSDTSREYRLIYAKFAQLLRTRQSLVDLTPLQLVADAFLLGQRRRLAPFEG